MVLQLKAARERRHLSQEQVALSLHVSRQLYGMYERGERQPPITFIAAFSDLACVSVDTLLGRKEGGFPISSEEEILLKGFRRLDASGRQYILEQTAYEQELAKALLFADTGRLSPLG